MRKRNTLSPVSTVIISSYSLGLKHRCAQEIAGNLNENYRAAEHQQPTKKKKREKHQILIFLFAALKSSFQLECFLRYFCSCSPPFIGL